MDDELGSWLVDNVVVGSAAAELVVDEEERGSTVVDNELGSWLVDELGS